MPILDRRALESMTNDEIITELACALARDLARRHHEADMAAMRERAIAAAKATAVDAASKDIPPPRPL